MSDLLSFLNTDAYEKLVNAVKENFGFDDREIDGFLEELLRRYLERREVSVNEFKKIIDSSLLKVRIFDKLSKHNYQILKNEKAYENLFNTIKEFRKPHLAEAFVYCYIRGKTE